jgi:hypothetical protein
VITIILTPQRIEYLGYFREFAEQYDVLIAEVPDIESVNRFLRGEIGFNNLLYDIEYSDLDYTRAFYETLRDLNNRGVSVIPIDPYESIAMRIRVASIVKNMPRAPLDYNDKYIAYIESRIGEVMRRYGSAFLRGDFDEIVQLTIRYAKMDAERIKFRSELRAREIVRKLHEVRGDVLIHADHYNEVLRKYLGAKLGCILNTVSLFKVASKRLGIDIPQPPGLKLTLNYISSESLIRDKTEDVVLGARTVVYVMLRSRVLRRISSMDHRKAIIADSALLKYVYGLSYEDAKQLFYKLMRRDLFKIRV